MSDNEDETLTTTGSPPSIQSRTLLHYFGKKGSDEKKKVMKTLAKEKKVVEKVRKTSNEKNNKDEAKENEDLNQTKTTPTSCSSSSPSIGQFFKKVSSAEYRQVMSDQLGKSVLVVRADVHSPISGSKPDDLRRQVLDRDSKSSSGAKIMRKRRKSNVSRSSNETDQIEVVEMIEEKEEDEISSNLITNKVENEKSDGIEVTRIISTTLFTKKNRKNSLVKEEVSKDKKVVLEHDDQSVDFDFLKVKTSCEKNEEEKREEDHSRNEKTIVTKEEDKKISMESNPSSPTTKKSPQLFKQRVPNKKRGRPRKAIKVNYDSDSIDVDVLTTLAEEKSLLAPSPTTSPSTSNFSVLMKNPISDGFLKQNNKKKNEEIKEAEEKKSEKGSSTLGSNNAFAKLMSSAATKINKKSASKGGNDKDLSAVESSRKVKEEVAIKSIVTDNVRQQKPKKRGRKRKAGANHEDLIKNEAPQQPEVKNQTEQITIKDDEEEKNEIDHHSSVGRRRASSRISRNKSFLEEKRKEEEELDKLLKQNSDSEDEVGKKFNDSIKRKRRKTKNDKIELEREEEVDSNDEVIVEKIVISPAKKNAKKGAKNLAPIFIKGKAAKPLKVIEDPEKVAARKAFLLSSVPEAMRIQIDTSRENDESAIELDASPFPSVAHIRQDEENDPFWTLNNCHLANIKRGEEEKGEEELCLQIPLKGVVALGLFSKLEKSNLNSKHGVSLETRNVSRMSSSQIYHFVKSLKMLNDNFPINKIFRRYVERKIEWDTLESEALTKNVSLNEIEEKISASTGGSRRKRLRRHHQILQRLKKTEAEEEMPPSKKKMKKSNETENDDSINSDFKYDPDFRSSMSWTMKYAPQSGDDIIGNFKVVKQFQSWLEEWKYRKRSKKTNFNNKRKKSSKDSSFIASSSSEDDDSFHCSSDSDTDGDEDHERKNNTALLTGVSGIGKTSTVYAIAQQLGFKVLEVNASSARGGRQVVAQLHEATQSHHVSKQQQQQQLSVNKKVNMFRKIVKKTSLNKTALILFEDVDVVFEDQDEGFYAAVNNLISTTKRPIILTTSNPNFDYKKFLKSSPQPFPFKSVPARITADYLQLLCLTEGFPVSKQSITALVSLNRGIISRSMIDLQYWVMTGASGLIIQLEDQSNQDLEIQEEDKKKNAQKIRISLDDSRASESESKSGVEKLDLIAKLLSINDEDASGADDVNSSCCGGAVRLLLGCAETKMGLDVKHQILLTGKEGEDSFPRQMFGFYSKLQHLWSYGLGTFYDRQKYLIVFPFPSASNCIDGEKSALFEEKKMTKFSRWSEESQKEYGRKMELSRRYDNSIFTTEGSSSEEEGKEENGTTKCEMTLSTTKEENKPSNILKSQEERNSFFKKSLKTINELSRCAEISSHFLPFSDASSWWVTNGFYNNNNSEEEEDKDDSLGEELFSYLHQSAMIIAKGNIKAALSDEKDKTLFTLEGKEEEEESFSLPLDKGGDNFLQAEKDYWVNETDRTVLNQILPEFTTSPRVHIQDTLPIVRSIARSEMIRKAGKGPKVSRSGRFVNYFERQEMPLDNEVLESMCSIFYQ